MKILQISSASSIGGGERHVADLTNALVEKGHELYAALRPGSPLIPLLNIPTERIATLPLRNALDVQSARRLTRFSAENKIDVIHAHMARDYSLAAFAAKRARAKLIVTRHVLFPLSRIHRRTLAAASKVIAVSQAVADQLMEQNIVEPNRITVVLNGIEVSGFSDKQSLDRAALVGAFEGMSDAKFLVGTIGELRALKRHDDFIRAAAIVRSKIDGVHFVVAGIDTSPKQEIRKQLLSLIAELGLENQVHLLGWLDDAPHFLQSLDLFVSASETESFGLAIVEAMAAATPVIATSTGGAREVIDPGRTGLMVPIGDVQVLADAIVSLLLDRERRKVMGQLAKEEVAARFSLERMAADTEAIYFNS